MAAVDVAMVTTLMSLIPPLLHKAKRALGIREIQIKLIDGGVQITLNREPDLYDVRDAVSELAAKGEVELVHPGYLAKLKEPAGGGATLPPTAPAPNPPEREDPTA